MSTGRYCWEFNCWIGRKGKVPHSVQCIRIFLHVTIQSVLRQAGSPGFIEPLLERPALIGPAIMIVARRNNGTDSGQMWWMRNSREHLGRAHIRSAKHAHLAVR